MGWEALPPLRNKEANRAEEGKDLGDADSGGAGECYLGQDASYLRQGPSAVLPEIRGVLT